MVQRINGSHSISIINLIKTARCEMVSIPASHIVMTTSLIMHKFSKSLWFFLATMLLICRRGRGARESGKVGTLVSQKSQQGNREEEKLLLVILV
jgi:hypothetical protein